jgi:Domain of unknown function (DUF4383)
MKIRYFALIIGIIYGIIGVLGFVPTLLSLPATAPILTVKAGYGYLFSLFPVNLLHNIVHLVVGVLGIIAYRSLSNAQLFARGLTILYAVLAVLGLIPATSTLFGLVPLFSHNIWLHAVTAAIAAYFGFVAPRAREIGAQAT